MAVLEVLWHGIRDSLLMAWEVWWALVLGFAISAIVQVWVPRERVEAALSGSGAGPVALATGLGAASSSCSYAAVAIARSLFAKGASAASALAFQIASTNLVWELGLVLWALIGWQFTLGEYLGGIVMIALIAVALRILRPARLEAQARGRAQQASAGHGHHGGCARHEQHGAGHEQHDAGHEQHGAGHERDDAGHGQDGAGYEARFDWRTRAAWTQVAQNFLADWRMLYREIAIGFLLSGFVAQLGSGFFNGLFLRHSSGALATLENVIVGPLIAVLSFVCSVGNVPLAAVLWSGGISFAGVLAFLFADLIVLPIVVIYRKLYGDRAALRIVLLLLASMIAAALIVNGVFGALGLIPGGPRPSRSAIFGGLALDYKLYLNVAALLLFAALAWLALRRSAQPPRPRACCTSESRVRSAASASSGT
ncbi:MAG TPA: permease [Solirubrobacteraceae bacterium]|jgi:hypothetical protein